MRLITFLLKDEHGKNTIPAMLLTHSADTWNGLRKKFPELAFDKGAKQVKDISLDLFLGADDLPLDQLFIDKKFNSENFIEQIKVETQTMLEQKEQLDEAREKLGETEALVAENTELKEKIAANDDLIKNSRAVPFVDDYAGQV